MKIVIFLCVLCGFLTNDIYSQAKNTSFSNLSSPEKWWVIWHPFKARNALEVSVKTLQITDSIHKVGVIGTDMNGGKLDAFKHAYWMASLSQSIGEKAAIKLGKAHEKGNYRSFLQGKPEDGFLPDKSSSDMDLFNNEAGVQIYLRNPNESEITLAEIVIQSVVHGKLMIIKKEGALFFTCEGTAIDASTLKGKWENDKCLIPSDESLQVFFLRTTLIIRNL